MDYIEHLSAGLKAMLEPPKELCRVCRGPWSDCQCEPPSDPEPEPDFGEDGGVKRENLPQPQRGENPTTDSLSDLIGGGEAAPHEEPQGEKGGYFADSRYDLEIQEVAILNEQVKP